MFTGIVSEVGTVQNIIKANSLTKLSIQAKIIFPKVKPSDSVSVNGTCLTLIGKKENLLLFEVIESTLKTTNLKRLKKADPVNLEPALSLGDKLSGHFVLGHVDTEARLQRIIKKGSHWQLAIELPSRFRKFVVQNGSIALEGISLTVKNILPTTITTEIVPFTYNNTNLKYKKAGNWLNVEFDYLLKQTRGVA